MCWRRDGDVDWQDLWYEMFRQVAPTQHADYEKQREKYPTLRDVNERLERLERLLTAKLGPFEEEKAKLFLTSAAPAPSAPSAANSETMC
jgi:hypothetical protein